MQGLQPQQLTNAELKHYASLYSAEQLPQEWLLEIARRFTGQSLAPEIRRGR